METDDQVPNLTPLVSLCTSQSKGDDGGDGLDGTEGGVSHQDDPMSVDEPDSDSASAADKNADDMEEDKDAQDIQRRTRRARDRDRERRGSVSEEQPPAESSAYVGWPRDSSLFSLAKQIAIH